LPKALAFEDDPVVVPVRKEVAREPCSLGLDVGVASEECVRGCLHLPQVDRDRTSEAQSVPGGVDQPRLDAVNPPERRAEVRGRPLLGAVEPERTCDIASKQRPVVKSDEGDDALSSRRELLASRVADELEAIEETKPDLLAGIGSLGMRLLATRRSLFWPQQ